jgi:DNA-binding Lrp family transcriptional regulator
LTSLDALDKRILSAIQTDFPVCKRPFQTVAQNLGISENTLIEKIIDLKERKAIRRFGAVFDSHRLGFESTLVAVRIPDPHRIPLIAREINRLNEVTHNYERDDSYNLWFTIIAENDKRIREIVEKIAALPGVADIKSLPAQEVYKIRASFDPKGNEEGG